jgi:nitrate reductase cytochrome c-type subunit
MISEKIHVSKVTTPANKCPDCLAWRSKHGSGGLMISRNAAWFVLSTGMVMIAAGLAVSCAPDTRAPVFQARQTVRQPSPASAARDLPTQVALEPFTDHACLDCHTDQTRLVSLAVAKPAAETPSEGPG